MRVIGGEFRSRRLKSVPGLETRPTPDRLREALFDVLAPRMEGAVFLDGYAGSGAVGIEALSRGAARAVFIERSRAAVRTIQENLAALGLESRAVVVAAPVLAAVGRQEADIVFLDPPYENQREYTAALAKLGETGAPLVLIQHSSRVSLPEEAGRLRRVRVLRQGSNAVSFFEGDLEE
ncbi:MAG: 16S rRNA (guanine(966)-N(2))-methyltransferase RsmD [Bryobacterales bacterium]|nr:16S rRNA (guanine(966)-N(2))-methyltransferase RsmD [Bryobacterales bacterium]